jgi:predicted secreted hydrolase
VNGTNLLTRHLSGRPTELRPYRTQFHGTFDEEWEVHGVKGEWWYATGIVFDEAGRMYTYQYTLYRAPVPVLGMYMLQLAFTDVGSGRHIFVQVPTLRQAAVTSTELRFGDYATVRKEERGMRLRIRTPHFGADLFLDYGKGASWHCDNGVLQMGLREAKETTVYYSYTNMPTTGSLTVDGRRLEVTGKTWFDRQFGTYTTSRFNEWEWFSLRFLDDEEMMLFTFPHVGRQDGTYIPREGGARRLQDYTVTPTGFTVSAGFAFSRGWTLDVPGLKAERYTLEPLTDGQFNLVYFELISGVYDPDHTLVGYCFVELMPGVRNTRRIPIAPLLRRHGL